MPKRKVKTEDRDIKWTEQDITPARFLELCRDKSKRISEVGVAKAGYHVVYWDLQPHTADETSQEMEDAMTPEAAKTAQLALTVQSPSASPPGPLPVAFTGKMKQLWYNGKGWKL